MESPFTCVHAQRLKVRPTDTHNEPLQMSETDDSISHARVCLEFVTGFLNGTPDAHLQTYFNRVCTFKVKNVCDDDFIFTGVAAKFTTAIHS